MVTFGSVCSGVEAASVAWHPLGWKAAWLSEIEAFPSAVLAHHYPDVPNHGDMTLLADRVLSGEIEAPDALVGGTPCQAFSVAGLRHGLKDKRGQLTLAYVELLNAIDAVRERRVGEQPAIAIWENVPGCLSDKTNAFGCLLAALCGEDTPLLSPGGKWPNAGCVYGPKRTVAWRILDAQYFGVAQRRRRVFVVASARKGFNPAEVLFECEGLRRDNPPSREAGQETASDAGSSVALNHWDGDYPHPTLNQCASKSGGVGASNQELFSQRGAYLVPGQDIAPTIEASYGRLQGQSGQDVGNGCPHLMIGAFGGDKTTGPIEVSPAILTKTGQRNDFNTEAMIAHAFKIRGGCDGGGKGYLGQDEAAFTISTIQDQKLFHNMRVRRLTPRECERLQGFPDDYTLVPLPLKKRQTRVRYSADGPRYKAMGNSMAVPVMAWIGQRINNQLENMNETL